MHYLITGKLFRAAEVLSLPHDQFVEFTRSRLVPALRLLVEGKARGQVVAGGTPAGGRDCVMIVDLPGDSHAGVRNFLDSLPIFDYYEWQVTPLETFEEWLSGFVD